MDAGARADQKEGGLLLQPLRPQPLPPTLESPRGGRPRPLRPRFRYDDSLLGAQPLLLRRQLLLLLRQVRHEQALPAGAGFHRQASGD